MTVIACCRHDNDATCGSQTRWKQSCGLFGRWLTKLDTLLCAAAAGLWRSVLEGFANYGRWHGSHPVIPVEPTQWQEGDLDRLLDVPPSSNRRDRRTAP